MAASSSPPAVARPSSDSHHRHPKRESSNSVAKRRRRDSSSKHRDHHHERNKRHASSSDAAASSTSASSSSDSASSDSDSSQSSSSSEDHRRRPQRRSSKRKHHHHRDESSSDSDSDGSERSRKHRRKDVSSKKVKERRKEGSKHKDKKHRRKEKSKKDGAGPVQLSKFLGRDKDSGVRRSVVSGKKCLGVADTNEGGEDQRRQIGRDKSHGASEVFELQLRLNHAVLGFVDIVQYTAWSWYLIARNTVTIGLCCLFLDSDPLLDPWLPFQTKEFLYWASFPRALTPPALLLGVCYFLFHICIEGTQFSEVLQHFGDCFFGSPALNHICYVSFCFIIVYSWNQCTLRI